MAKSPRYEETLYFLQTLGPSRPSESDSADDYFAGIPIKLSAPHLVQPRWCAERSSVLFALPVRYVGGVRPPEVEGDGGHRRHAGLPLCVGPQAKPPCTRQTPAEHSGQCGGDSCRVICRYGLPMVCARLLPCGLRARRGRPGSLWRYRRFTGGTYAQRTQLLRFLSACRPRLMFQACAHRRFGMG